MVNSMTGYAAGQGAFADYSWSWDLRSVNGRGLDLRIRVPDFITGLEAQLRASLGKQLGRGSVNLNLRLSRDVQSDAIAINSDALHAAINVALQAESAARSAGLVVTPISAADLLAQKGVMDGAGLNEDTTPLRDALLREFDDILAAFKESRKQEGAALEAIIGGQIDAIERLTTEAEATLPRRKEQMEAQFQTNLRRLVDNVDDLDQTRIAQELATLSVKADVTEEIDRLKAHIVAARGLIADGSAPVGRKLDFLIQEFMRETNTLCSKSQDKALTAIGLELKSVIDQMREQVQNVE